MRQGEQKSCKYLCQLNISGSLGLAGDLGRQPPSTLGGVSLPDKGKVSYIW